MYENGSRAIGGIERLRRGRSSSLQVMRRVAYGAQVWVTARLPSRIYSRLQPVHAIRLGVHDEHHHVGAVRQASVETVSEAFDGNHGNRLVPDFRGHVDGAVDGMNG